MPNSESIQKLCNADSLLEDFESALQQSAREGIYQISVASKVLESEATIANLARDEVEPGLDFLGVVDFKNGMRQDAPDVI